MGTFLRQVQGASDQLQSKTREAAERAVKFEKAAELKVREAEELCAQAQEGRAEAEGRATAAEQAARAAAEARDRAEASERKAHVELSALRLHLLDAEEASEARDKEAAAHEAERAAHAEERARLLEAASTQRQADGGRSSAAEGRAARAEAAAAAAERRVSEQTVVLTNLQSLLDTLTAQPGGADEPTQLRIGGLLLVTELRALEAALAEGEGARLAADALPGLHAELDAATAERERASEEVGRLRSAAAAQGADEKIDKKVVSSLLEIMVHIVSRRLLLIDGGHFLIGGLLAPRPVLPALLL